MLTISTKTDEKDKDAGSRADFEIKICDEEGNCCQTETIRQERAKGKLDVFYDPALLGSCSVRIKNSISLIISVLGNYHLIHVVRVKWHYC